MGNGKGFDSASEVYAARRDPHWTREETVVWLTLALQEVVILYDALGPAIGVQAEELRRDLAKVIADAVSPDDSEGDDESNG